MTDTRRHYLFELMVEEGQDEFWESLSGSGCDEVTEAIAAALASHGFYVDDNCTLRLRRFDRGRIND